MTTKVKVFELAFIKAITESTEADCKWLELSLEAPDVFGKQCFDKGTDDYQALRDVTQSAYAETQGGMPVKPERKDISAKAMEAREMRQKITTVASVYMSRMAGYFAQANGIQRDKKKVTLEAWLKRILTQCKGKKAIVSAPQSLVDAIESCMAQPAKATKKSNVIKANFAPAKRTIKRAVAA